MPTQRRRNAFPGIVGVHGEHCYRTAQQNFNSYTRCKNAGRHDEAQYAGQWCVQMSNELLTNEIYREVPLFHPWKAKAVVILIRFEGVFSPRVNDLVQRIISDIDVRLSDPTIVVHEGGVTQTDLYDVRHMVMEAVNDDPKPFRMAQ